MMASPARWTENDRRRRSCGSMCCSNVWFPAHRTIGDCRGTKHDAGEIVAETPLFRPAVGGPPPPGPHEPERPRGVEPIRARHFDAPPSSKLSRAESSLETSTVMSFVLLVQ